MPNKDLLDRLDEIRYATAGEQRKAIAEAITEIRSLRAEVAVLTDATVAAAAVVFEQIPAGSERDYATEALHLTATDLVQRNPRLTGAFTPLH